MKTKLIFGYITTIGKWSEYEYIYKLTRKERQQQRINKRYRKHISRQKTLFNNL